MLTLKAVKAQLALSGVVIAPKNDAGDYRVNLKGGSESTAYYTNCLHDALGTGLAMAPKIAPDFQRKMDSLLGGR